jgi:DNA-3-methyladenine glycosylase
MTKLNLNYYTQDVLHVAPDLLGKEMILKRNSVYESFIISETEAYRGMEDLACHASKGRTSRTEIMFHQGGKLYIYLIYGVHWMLNIVTGEENNPQAVLIRSVENCNGPGRLTKMLGVDNGFYGESLINSKRIWVEDSGYQPKYCQTPRIGIDYAGEIWKNKPWRFIIKS